MWTGQEGWDWFGFVKYTVGAVLVVASSALGGYWGAYAKKKGENTATHEDIGNLLEQVQAVTKATEEIKSEISGGLWDRQKLWELRRDTIFELTKRLGLLKDSLTVLISVHQTDLKNGWQDDVNRTQNRIKVGQEWLDASAAFDNAILMAWIVCDQNLYKSLLQFSLNMRQVAAKTKEWDDATLAKGTGAVGKELAVVMDAIRKELEVDQKLEGAGK